MIDRGVFSIASRTTWSALSTSRSRPCHVMSRSEPSAYRHGASARAAASVRSDARRTAGDEVVTSSPAVRISA
ncbi:hypothetical protein Pd630_LPD01815 [Rhodococcus opacus PD630]|nr:hypothetical protein Pd630_LPD01815 [Rhodococcus opacus PD630]